MVPLEQLWSTMVRIELYPLHLGSPMIRSIVTYENGLMFIRDVIWNSGVFEQCVRIFVLLIGYASFDIVFYSIIMLLARSFLFFFSLINVILLIMFKIQV